MLLLLNTLHNFRLKAKDGEIGRVEEFYFDDQRWAIRYLVANTGSWLFGRRVLISPASLARPDFQRDQLPVDLTRRQIEDSPPLESHEPVSRQKEAVLARYYGWPMYWSPGYIEPLPSMGPVARTGEQEPAPDPNLRSTSEVTGYHIHAMDGEIGHVQDFIVQDSDWGIRYLLVDTRNWLPGRRVLVSPMWVTDVNWAEEQVYANLPRETIRESPAFDAARLASAQYQQQIEDYFHNQDMLAGR